MLTGLLNFCRSVSWAGGGVTAGEGGADGKDGLAGKGGPVDEGGTDGKGGTEWEPFRSNGKVTGLLVMAMDMITWEETVRI